MKKIHYGKRSLQLNNRNSRDIQRELWCFLLGVHACATADDDIREILEHDLENRRIGFLNFFARPITEIVDALENAETET